MRRRVFFAPSFPSRAESKILPSVHDMASKPLLDVRASPRAALPRNPNGLHFCKRFWHYRLKRYLYAED